MKCGLSEWYSLFFMLSHNPLFKLSHHSQHDGGPIWMNSVGTLYLQEDENMLSWLLTKRTDYFKRPILLGSEQSEIAGSVDSTESKHRDCAP